jgi:hypothetical protein
MRADLCPHEANASREPPFPDTIAHWRPDGYAVPAPASLELPRLSLDGVTASDASWSQPLTHNARDV